MFIMTFHRISKAGFLFGVALAFSAAGAAANHHNEVLAVVAQATEGAQPAAKTLKPGLEFEVETFDFGLVEEGEVVEVKFPFVNKSDRTITVETIRASCGCTAAKIGNKKVFTPGEGTVIEAKFDTSRRSGRQIKTVTVKTDDPAQNTYQVKLEGEIVSRLNLEPRLVNLGQVRQGESASESVFLYDMTEEGVDIQSIDLPQKGLKVELMNPVSHTEEKLGLQGKKYEIKVTATDELPLGQISTAMIVRTSSRTNPQVTARVMGTVVGDLTFSPNQVYFGILEPEKEVNKRLRLQALAGDGKGRGKFELTSFKAEHDMLPRSGEEAGEEPMIDVTVSDVQKGSPFQYVDFKFKSADAYGRYSGRIILEGKIGEREAKASIPYSVFVRNVPTQKAEASNSE